MSASPIASAILGAQATTALRLRLAARSILTDFPIVESSTEDNAIRWSSALTLASALVAEDDATAQDMALRVAQGCLSSEETLEHHRKAAAILLERMGNRPSLALATDRNRVSVDSWTDAPAPLQLDVIRRRLQLAIPITGGGIVAANPFQRDFWSTVESSSWVSISAPTSAGKSYIVRRWFEERLMGRERFTGIYVVPTRALIEEVSADLTKQFSGRGVGVYTIPWDEAIDETARKLLVMTQERLHLLQQRLLSLGCDLLFVDEAQKFGDGPRGVLLQQTVEEVVRRSPDTQVVFASPLTSNPEILLEGATPTTKTSVVKSETITVNQNLLWADQVPRRPMRWRLGVVFDGEPNGVGEFDLPARPQPDSKRLPLVAVALGGASEGGNVVYVNGAAEAEKAARQIYDALGSQGDPNNDQGIADLRDLVQRTIHTQYALATVLQRGVAFHYGNMPLLVRAEIERLFRIGSVRYLVCTSTLLEGVNLPCRNLFARNPKKGNGNPMSAADFWNLAGRAGRWGQEFQGNIVCVDANQRARWPELPRVRQRQPVVRATTAALNDVAAVLSYIEAGAPLNIALGKPILETVYSYLATRTLAGTGLANLPEVGVEDAFALEQAIRVAHAATDIDASLVERHAGISPAAMQRLLDRFRAYPDPEELVLSLPESDDVVTVYAAALSLCDEELGSNFGNSARHVALAILITNWMRGHPLARLISSRIEYLRRANRPVDVPKEIRFVMADVEQFARFKAPKYLACYSDVLSLHVRQLGRDDLQDVQDISMMLELGVSRTTELSLMALGLSRTSTIALSEFIVADNLSREEAAQWVRAHGDVQLGLPALIRREIEEVFGLPVSDEQ